MTINQIIEEIAHYRNWVERQPLGAPIDTEAYRRHLEVEQACGIANEVLAHALEEDAKRIVES